jgi:hypothetical protein
VREGKREEGMKESKEKGGSGDREEVSGSCRRSN